MPEAGWCASYDDLAAFPGLDAVYVATPNSLHAACARLYLAAGVAVLCEKPFAVTGPEAEAVIATARESGALCAEGMWTLHFPAVRAMLELVAGGDLGTVTRVEASFGCEFGPEDVAGNFGKTEMGGGALLDIGVYPVALAFAVARALGHDPATAAAPAVRAATATLLPTGVDGETEVELVFSLPQAQGSAGKGAAAAAAPTGPAAASPSAGAGAASAGAGAGASAGPGAGAGAGADAGSGGGESGGIVGASAASDTAGERVLTCVCRASALRDMPNEAWVYGTRGKCCLPAPFWAPDRLLVYPAIGTNTPAGSEAGAGAEAATAGSDSVAGAGTNAGGAAGGEAACTAGEDACTSHSFPLPGRAPAATCAENFDNTRGMAYQIIAVQEALAAGKRECTAVSHASTLAVMRVLDAVRSRVGVVFPQDA